MNHPSEKWNSVYEPKSNCCYAQVIIRSSDEGTSYYECSTCHKPCDMEMGKDLTKHSETSEKEPEQICGYCNHSHYPGSPHIFPTIPSETLGVRENTEYEVEKLSSFFVLRDKLSPMEYAKLRTEISDLLMEERGKAFDS